MKGIATRPLACHRRGVPMLWRELHAPRSRVFFVGDGCVSSPKIWWFFRRKSTILYGIFEQKPGYPHVNHQFLIGFFPILQWFLTQIIPSLVWDFGILVFPWKLLSFQSLVTSPAGGLTGRVQRVEVVIKGSPGMLLWYRGLYYTQLGVSLNGGTPKGQPKFWSF